MTLKVAVNEKEPGVFTVTLWGPLDTTTYESFEKEIQPVLVPTTKAILLNMEGVNYISSLGIGSIFKLFNSLKALKGALLLTNLQPQIKKVFDTVKAMPEALFTSIQEADDYLNDLQKK